MFIIKLLMLRKCTKRRRELFTSLTFLRYWGKPNYLKRVRAHAERREPSTFVLDSFF